MAPLERPALTALVARLQAGDYTDGEELDRDGERLRSAVPHPDALGLIFHPHRSFDHEPTADEVVERGLAHRAVAL